MRLAVLADIHGNLPAFEAALDHVASQRVDRVVIAGDVVVGAPDSLACWRLAQSLACPILRGNHERYVIDHGTPRAPAIWTTAQFAPVHWAIAQLAPADRAALAALPLSLRLPEAPDLLLVHASLRSDADTIGSYTPAATLAEMFPDPAGDLPRWIIRAHNHVGQSRLWGDRVIVTNGSVGLALDGNPTAQYLIVEQRAGGGWALHHQSVPYDVGRVVRRFQDSGCLAATGPIGRLFLREIVTATQQLVPFHRAYARWQQREPVSLDAAVERFLADPAHGL